jgi:hypothetical protein
MVNDPGLREELNSARGYCREHGWMLVRTGSALGVAILTKGVVKTLLHELDTVPATQGVVAGRRSLRRVLGRERPVHVAERLVERLSPQVPCPACAHARSLEGDYLKTLVKALDGSGSMERLYGSSDGLCFSHFRLALEMVTTRIAGTSLVAAQRAVWHRLEDELGEFIRKSDYRFRDEGFGVERDAWLRALAAVSGPKPRVPPDMQRTS